MTTKPTALTHRNGQTLPTLWHNLAIIAFEEDFDRPLELDEKVAICAHTRREVQRHYRAETGKTPPF